MKRLNSIMENTENIIYEITKRKLIFNSANESKMCSIYPLPIFYNSENKAKWRILTNKGA